MLRLFRGRSKAPLALAGLLSVPLFFAALMASSLAIDRPRIFHRIRGGKAVLHYAQPSNATEAKIWLLSLVPVAILLLVAGAATLWRRGGSYVVTVAAIALAVLLPHDLDSWTARHTKRFPRGIDLIRDGDPSNLSSRGEWEAAARDTVVSLTHWTIGIALAAVFVLAVLALRRRFAPRAPGVALPPPIVTGEPEVAPLLDAELGRSQLVRRGLAARLFGGGRS